MHKENYNINIACFCNENFTNALVELKTFFGFNLILYKNLKEFKNDINSKKNKSILNKLSQTKKVRSKIIKLKQDTNKPDFGRN